MKAKLGRIGTALIAAFLVVSCATSKLHQEGLDDVDHGRYESGIAKLQQAAAADPGNLTYRLDVASRKDEAIAKLISAGDKARSEGDLDAATVNYQRVLAMDSGVTRASRGLEAVEGDRRHNQAMSLAVQDFKAGNFDMAQTRISAILNEDPGFGPAVALQNKIEAVHGPVNMTPKLRTKDNRPVTLQFRDAQTKMVFEVLSRQTGINFIFDKDIKSDGKTTIFVQDVPVEQAIDLVLGQNQLARQVLSDNMVLIYPNTSSKQKDYQDQIVKTFYLNTAIPKDVEGLLKTVLDAKTLVVNERANAIVMRDTPETIRMAEKLVASIDVAEPEVMMEVEILEISRGKLQQLGITYPSSFTMTTTSPSGASSMTLKDLQNQNSSTIAVTPLSITIDALKTTSAANLLASPRIRARNKEKAKVLIGSKVPVITTAATASGNGGVISNSQVQYLDVGLTLEVEPQIYSDNDVGIGINLIVSSIASTVKVGDTIAYELRNRNATTKLQLKDGETQILAGLINDTESRSATTVPGLGDIPIIGRLFGNYNTQKDKSELVMSITPHVIRAKARPPGENTEFWYGTESRSGMEPLRNMGPGAAPVPTAGVAAPPSASALGVAGTAGTAGAVGAAGVATTSSTAGAAVSPSTEASGAGPAAEAARAPVNVSSAGSQTAAAAAGAMGAAAMTAPSSTPGTPSARLAALQGNTPVPSGKPTESDGPTPHVTTTLVGPSELKVGDEFTVTLQMQTDQGVSKVRSQLRYDAAAFQLVSGDPGGLVPDSTGAKVIGRAGGAQLEATMPTGDTITGNGDLMVLKFKALQVRPQASISGQVTVMGASGAIMANSTPPALTLAVTQ